MSYRFFEHTADLGIEIEAPNLDSLLADGWRGLTESMLEVDRIEPVESRQLSVRAADLDRLLVDWLSEAIFLLESEGLVFSQVEPRSRQTEAGWEVIAALGGEQFDQERHGLKRQVKAVTHHHLEIGDCAAGWRARVILDL